MTGKREMVEEAAKSSKAWLIPVIAVAAVGLGFGGVCAVTAMSDAIFPNTYIAGENVGGMSVSEAAEALNPKLTKLRAVGKVEFYIDEEKIGEAGYADLGMKLDAQKNAEAAYEVGRGDGIVGDSINFLSSLFGKENHLPLVDTADDSAVQETSARISEQGNRAPQDFSYEVTEESLILTKARDGRSVAPTDVARGLDALS